jgi:prepilin-type N-terminal cleavage/methylation domain-containing protein
MLYLQRAFSLVEILVVIAVIAILSSLVIVALFGTAKQTSEIVARQQQAELQTALGNWITTTSSEPGGLAEARRKYTNTANKLSLLTNYLQEATYLRLTNTGNAVRSSALTASKARLEFSPSWSTTDAPVVNWVNITP